MTPSRLSTLLPCSLSWCSLFRVHHGKKQSLPPDRTAQRRRSCKLFLTKTLCSPLTQGPEQNTRQRTKPITIWTQISVLYLLGGTGPPSETVLTFHHTLPLLPAELSHKNDEANSDNVATLSPSRFQMSLKHERLPLGSTVLKLHLLFFVCFAFLAVSPSLAFSCSMVTWFKLKCHIKTWQDVNMWLPEASWKRSCWCCNQTAPQRPPVPPYLATATL